MGGRARRGPIVAIVTLESPAEAHHVEGFPHHPHGNTQLSEVFLSQLLELQDVIGAWGGRGTRGRGSEVNEKWNS